MYRFAVISLLLVSPSFAEEKEESVAALAKRVRSSVVVITSAGRDGKREGLGTGFVISKDGLIATNFHVLGEGREISIETSDGKSYEPTTIHASDRKLDLAVVRINAKELKPLEIGKSSKLSEGQSVVAVGHPQRLRYSVVAGVVSGVREIDSQSMIQVAIPIEPGNSGGPLFDRQGRVVGILTSKSLVTPNLGFAVPSDSLSSLLKKPNPVAMKAWLTIGQLDPEEWKVRGGAQWRQRAGLLLTEGSGSGFGGRSLCLRQTETPALPFEVSVNVKLDDEKGAAGLVFHADGGDKHYGFYPSSGNLRLTRFDGPNVFTWNVLHQQPSPHYRPGEWNVLKVRIDKGKFRCFVNDQFVFEIKDAGLQSGKVGLAKFRDTVAQFRRFRVAKNIPNTLPSTKARKDILEAIGEIEVDGPLPSALARRLSEQSDASRTVLREQARKLERQAEQLRKLARVVHHQSVLCEIEKVVADEEKKIDLLKGALLIARLDNEEVEVEGYLDEVQRLANKVRSTIAKDADEQTKLAALTRFLFDERGFHGSRGDYYNRSNSYLSEVIDDREGLPITLSLLYIELGRRMGLQIEGVGLPGHFVVRHRPKKGKPTLIDVFENGQPLTREQASEKVELLTGEKLRDADLEAVGPKTILIRMLHNLLRIAESEEDFDSALRYLDGILTIDPESPTEHGMRAALRARSGDNEGALADLEWLLDKRPDGIDLEKVQQFRDLLRRNERK